MAQNVGATDGTIRIGLGAIAGLVSLAILAGSLSLPALASPVLGLVAVILLGTGVTGVCPLYSVLGMDTCPADVR
jgi:tetrahydromethanopterin S-methyltransferase subunit C